MSQHQDIDKDIAAVQSEIGRLWTVVIGPDGANGLRSRVGAIEQSVNKIDRRLSDMQNALGGCVSEVKLMESLAELKQLFLAQEEKRDAARQDAQRRSKDLVLVKLGIGLTLIAIVVDVTLRALGL